jgi:hypothetical protein
MMEGYLRERERKSYFTKKPYRLLGLVINLGFLLFMCKCSCKIYSFKLFLEGIIVNGAIKHSNLCTKKAKKASVKRFKIIIKLITIKK